MLLLLPVILFIIIFLPYLSLIPGNDGNYEIIDAYHWFLGDNLLKLLSSHPPFKLILFNFFYNYFGLHSFGYIGLFFGIIGIIALYHIGKELFDKQTALLSSVFLATSGLYLSVGAFALRDFLTTVFMLVGFACYLKSRYIWYAMFLCLAVLTKESALFFALSIVLSEFITKKKVTFAALAPIIIFMWYIEIVYASGHHVWNQWNFSKTANKGSIYTIINNLVTLQVFNKYAYENWDHLFVFNFNWTYWIAAFISFFFIKKQELKMRLLPLLLFFLSVTLLLLSFQTYTINRYTLPLLPFLYLFTAFGITKMKFTLFFAVLFIFISFISLSYSVDPISNTIWQKTTVFNEKFYLNPELDGADGITYNLQYLTIMKKRTTMILHGKCKLPSIITFTRQTRTLFHITSCTNLLQ